MTIRQFLCGLSGHEYILKYESARLSLVCVSCDHESRGIDNDGPPPVPSLPFKRAMPRAA